MTSRIYTIFRGLWQNFPMAHITRLEGLRGSSSSNMWSQWRKSIGGSSPAQADLSGFTSYFIIMSQFVTPYRALAELSLTKFKDQA
jgi:hypothetical protein